MLIRSLSLSTLIKSFVIQPLLVRKVWQYPRLFIRHNPIFCSFLKKDFLSFFGQWITFVFRLFIRYVIFSRWLLQINTYFCFSIFPWLLYLSSYQSDTIVSVIILYPWLQTYAYIAFCWYVFIVFSFLAKHTQCHVFRNLFWKICSLFGQILKELRNRNLPTILVWSLFCLMRLYVGLHFLQFLFWKTSFLSSCAFFESRF